jgi:hypothetical protein
MSSITDRGACLLSFISSVVIDDQRTCATNDKQKVEVKMSQVQDHQEIRENISKGGLFLA